MAIVGWRVVAAVAPLLMQAKERRLCRLGAYSAQRLPLCRSPLHQLQDHPNRRSSSKRIRSESAERQRSRQAKTLAEAVGHQRRVIRRSVTSSLRTDLVRWTDTDELVVVPSTSGNEFDVRQLGGDRTVYISSDDFTRTLERRFEDSESECSR